MGGARHYIGDPYWTWMEPGGDEAGNVGDVREQIGADAVGDLAEALPVHDKRVCRVASDDDSWLRRCGQPGDIVKIDPTRLRVDTIAYRVIDLSGTVDWTAMRKMSPGVQVHAENRISGIKQARVDGIVCGSAAEGLYVDEQIVSVQAVSRKELRPTPACQCF
jgi:hypothetical protein